ncbi:MAG: hypothetical protein ACI4TF_00500, partial [Oliverpabstia sp.]
MRSEIIVTVKDSNKNFTTYDVEVPVNITAGKAAADIVEVLNYYKDKTSILKNAEYLLKNERTGSTLEPEKTLY